MRPGDEATLRDDLVGEPVACLRCQVGILVEDGLPVPFLELDGGMHDVTQEEPACSVARDDEDRRTGGVPGAVQGVHARSQGDVPSNSSSWSAIGDSLRTAPGAASGDSDEVLPVEAVCAVCRTGEDDLALLGRPADVIEVEVGEQERASPLGATP